MPKREAVSEIRYLFAFSFLLHVLPQKPVVASIESGISPQ